MHLPTTYYDLSQFRQIPDHQEVRADTVKDHSVIVELVEENDGVPEDALLSFHWRKLCQVNQCDNDKEQQVMQIVDDSKIPTSNLKVDYKACCIGMQRIAKARETAKNTVLVFLTVLKLKKYATEVLISMNLPIEVDIHSSTWYNGRETSMTKEEQEYWFKVYTGMLDSFDLRDASIFG